MMGEYPLVEIWWVDPTVSGGWETIEKCKELLPTRNRTVGYLLTDDKDYVRVAQSISEDEAGEVITIPQGVVKSIGYLPNGRRDLCTDSEES